MDSASSHLQPGPSNGKPSGTNSNDARWKSTPSMRSAAAAAANVSSATQGSTSTVAPTVYGPEPPPSMARSKASAGASEPMSFDLKNISMLLHGERRGDMSRSECMKQTEAELQRLFHSRLVEIMATNGYDDGGFNELDVANVMVANGLMSTPLDDPLVALATELKSEMSSIFHSNMRRMSNNVIDPEFLAGIASDPFVIDSIIDLSWGRVRGGDSSEVTAPFEGIAKALRNFSLPECFNHPTDDEDTDSNDGYEDDDTPDIPSAVSAQANLSDGGAAASATYSTQAMRGARNRGKAEDKGKDDATSSQRAPSVPVPIAATAPAFDSVDTAAPKATRGQRRRMRKSMYKTTIEPNGNHAAVNDLRPALGAPVSDVKSSTPLAGSATAIAESPAEKLVQAGRIYGSSPEGLLAKLPVMGPPPPPGACPPSPGTKLEKVLAAGPVQRMPVRVSAAEGGPVIDVGPLPPMVSVPVATLVASAPAVGAPVTPGYKRAVESTKTLWNSDAIEEQRRVREFWLSLGATERQELILAEKNVVQTRVREHQNFSCSCNVCSRKREAIENELDCLYDAYHKELKENVRKANMRSLIRVSEKKARSIIESSVGDIARSLISRAEIDAKNTPKDVVYRNIIDCLRSGKTVDIPNHCSEFAKLNELGSSVYTAAMSASDSVLTKIASVVRYLDQGSSYAKAIEDAGLMFKSSDKELATIRKAAVAIKEWTDGSSAFRREFGTKPFQSDDDGDDELINNNDLFYTDNMLDSIDTFPTDGKKFFDMMEQLAEYRMRREDAFLDGLDESEAGDDGGPTHESVGTSTHAWSRKARRQSRSQRRCPDCQGEIGEGEERQNYSDSEYHVARYAGTKRPRSESRVGDRAFATNSTKVQLDNISIEYVNHPDDLLPNARTEYSGDLVPSDDGEEDDDDGYEDEDEDEDDEDEDDEDDDDDDDLEDDEDDDTDDEYDDLDPENAEKDAEEGRRVFQLFAARLFEQRVINLYREKVARDRQQNLIKELEEEEKRMEAKEKRKQKKKLREKEKKRHIQQQKEEERRAKEEQERTEKEQRRVAQQKRVEEQLSKKREDESRAKKAMEERNRRILEQADKRLAKEREERQRAEDKRLEKEAREREERSRRQRPQVTQAPITTLTPSSVAASTTPASPKSAPPKPTADTLPAIVSPPALTKVASAQIPTSSASASVAARSPIAMFANSSTADDIFIPLPGTPLPDNAMLPTVNRPSPIFMASRPSLPMIHPAELPATPSDSFDFAPSRARANSGSNIHQPAPAPAPMPPFMSVAKTSPSPSVVPSEFDAEIMSIVGRVMGSCTLQDDLTNGAEWRTEPADNYLDSPRAMLPQSSHTATLGLGDPLGPMLDLSVRRNSVPVNRAGRECSNVSVGSFDISKQHMSSTLTGGMEGVYSAYCALEKFSRDKRMPAGAGLVPDVFGGSHSAAEIAQMHGSMRESSVWSLCASYAQANPSKCRLNHADRTIALARSLSGVSPIVPVVLDAQRLSSPASPRFAETPRSTPPVQLPMIAEDRVGGNGLPHSQISGSPTVVGLSARSQPRSPLLQSRQPAPMSLPMMPQFGQPQPQVGMNYSPVAHVSPSSLFFGPMATHGSQTPIHGGVNGSMPIRGPAPPFSLPPFQQSPLGASSLGHSHLGDSRGMAMIPPPPSMSMSNGGQMFGLPASFGNQLQMHQSNSPWPPTKLGSSDAVTLGELTQAAAMRQPLMTRLGSPHVFSQQQLQQQQQHIQLQHSQQQQQQQHQFHHQHPLH